MAFDFECVAQRVIVSRDRLQPRKDFFIMKKFLALLASVGGSAAAFAQESSGQYQIDTTEIQSMLTGAQGSLETFVDTAAPIVGAICFGFLVFTLIFVGLKIIKRASKSA